MIHPVTRSIWKRLLIALVLFRFPAVRMFWYAWRASRYTPDFMRGEK